MVCSVRVHVIGATVPGRAHVNGLRATHRGALAVGAAPAAARGQRAGKVVTPARAIHAINGRALVGFRRELAVDVPCESFFL